MPVEEALKTIKTDLARWKPNCALVMIDFALRHGFLDPDHPVRDADTGAQAQDMFLVPVPCSVSIGRSIWQKRVSSFEKFLRECWLM